MGPVAILCSENAGGQELQLQKPARCMEIFSVKYIAVFGESSQALLNSSQFLSKLGTIRVLTMIWHLIKKSMESMLDRGQAITGTIGNTIGSCRRGLELQPARFSDEVACVAREARQASSGDAQALVSRVESSSHLGSLHQPV